MNCLCADARAYLKKIDVDNSEIIEFIDRYNVKLSSYTKNGLSSYILECIEISIKLSRRANYSYGEALARTLRGDILSYGGQYKLAIKSYTSVSSLITNKELIALIEDKICFNRVCIGESAEDLDYKYELIDENIDSIEKYLILSSLIRDNIENKDFFNKAIIRLAEFTEGCSCIIKAHIDSLKCLSLREKNIGDRIGSIFNVFDKKEFFILYIDGMLNIAETFLKINLVENAEKLLNIIKDEKRELKLFDNKIEELYSRTEVVGII